MKFEWPLLIFPVLVIATFVILYAMDRSVKRELPTSPAQRQASPDNTLTGMQTGPGDPKATVSTDDLRSGIKATFGSGETSGAIGAADDPAWRQGDETMDAGSQAAFVLDRTDRRSDSQELHGTARIIAVLRQATRENDRSGIKQCLDELVALGDEAIAPLTELISAGDSEVGLRAAEALARIGTPAATVSLLDTLSDAKEGRYKEQLGKRVSSISNHESWPILLDTVLDTGDATLLRAASTSLSGMADSPVVDEIVARHDTATSEKDVERLTRLVSNIHSSEATESLLSLAGDISSAPQDGLQKAAVDALAKIGDPQCVSYLLRKLEASPPGEAGYLFSSIAQINQQAAHAPLLYAAAGNKEVSAEYGRAAAIHALKNFPDEQTCVLLERIIAQEDNTSVATAAVRTLESIRETTSHVTAKADPMADHPTVPDLVPLQK